MLQTKQQNIRMREQKELQEKEKLTSEIVLIHVGLWQTKDDVEQQLLKLKCETKKRRL